MGIVLVACGRASAPPPSAASASRTTETPVISQSPVGVAAVPAPREGAALAWDAKDQYLLMFGGAITGPDGANLTPDDTWAWTNHAWKALRTPKSPPGRTFPAMAYDPIRQQVVMFGGGSANSDPFRNDTWTWDGIDWTQVQPTTSPQPGMYLRMVFDAKLRSLILVRQSNLPGDALETWSWSGLTWTRVAIGSGPSPRWFFGLGNEPFTSDAMLVGGYYGAEGDPNASKNDTWTWDQGAWSQKQTAGASPAGYVATALDEGRHQAVLFTAGTNETWTFDGSSWLKRSPAHGPQPLLAHVALAYDPNVTEVFLFGGKTDSSPGTRYLNELWAWDGSDWIKA